MEQEKINEIKKALVCCSSPICPSYCPLRGYYSNDYKMLCRDKLVKDCLTLINELEKENESLKKQLIAIDTLDETNFEKRHNAIVFITEKQLKQFAERLKDEIGSMKQFFRSYIDRDYCGLTEDQVDEKLREFVK